GIQTSGRHGADGLRAVPRLHDVRPGGRRGGVQGPRRPLPRGRGQLRGHRRRLHKGCLRGDHRQGPQGCARRGGARHEGPFPDGGRPQRRGPLPQARGPGLRGQPQAPRHGLYRPLPGPLLGRGDAAGGDARRPLGPRAGRQGPLRGRLELHGVAAHEERGRERRPGLRAVRVPAAPVLARGAQHRARGPAGLRGGGARRDPLESSGRRLPLGEVPPRGGAAAGLAHLRGRGVDGGVLGSPRHRAQLGRPRRRRRDKRGHRQVLRPDLPQLASPPAGRDGPHHRGPHRRAAGGQPRRLGLGAGRRAGEQALRGGRPRGHLPLPFYPQRPAGL
ncbi:MAG: L-fuco-beta-pyranose dehydrogenase, partial [uncultured Rubrobacteraceae bacterium]